MKKVIDEITILYVYVIQMGFRRKSLDLYMYKSETYKNFVFKQHFVLRRIRNCLIILNTTGSPIYFFTVKCLSIGTPRNNKFSICSKWKIDYFQVSQNLGALQPSYNVLEYWNT